MSLNKIAPSRIIGIQFSMLSPEEIERNSVVEIKSRDTYVNNKPLPEGLFDPRMGVLEPGLICPTDGLTYIDTPGYFGCIKLAKPVLFIQHIKDIMKIVKCVCFKCSKLKINKNQHKHIMDYPLEKRWDYVAPLAAKIRRCGEATDDGCGCKQPDKVKLEGFEKIYAIWDGIKIVQEDGTEENTKVNMRLTPEILLKIFRRISDEDVSFMGFSPVWSRPEWMICMVLPVPPPAVRPSVKLDAQQRSEDDLTHIYANIVKTNKDLFEKLQKPDTTAAVIDGLTSVLQYFIAMIVNNKIKGAVPMAQRSGRPLQCIMGRLNSKNGRIRGNLMGKRVDYSARSVITGDPNLSVQQLGVPLKIAKNLTKPVIVNDKNRDFLIQLINNGPDIHPGAKIVERKNGEMISLRYADVNSIRLENGDIVHRHMMDGDAVLFNRQPSLHRMSMMCHIVKIMKQGDSFRFNVACTKPYNADFDGDEMNMHLPQNILAETELRHLAAIPYQMLSPVGPSPVVGIYQDSLLGSFRFTRPKVKFTDREAMNLLMMFSKVDVDKLQKNRGNLTSFDVLSQIMPELTLKYKKDDNVLEIRNGEYISGQLDKSILGGSTKGILHRIYNDFGPFSATDFIDDLQNIITEYMKTSSFSVGISDLIANKVTQEKIVQIITEKKMEVQVELDKLHLGIFENDTSSSNMVAFETTVNNLLNKATELSGKEGRKNLSKDNRFLMIVESGSKGSLVNISQMISCLGQTNVDGKRISYGFQDRTLPHFKKFDDSPGARGFIENSYISGLTAPELFFHAMGGRIGLIDTAVKSVTWETPIVILENDKPKYIEIGKWIDEQLAEKSEEVQHFTERQMELLNLDSSVFIPTTDENGIVTWGEITAITRHDPGTELYEIKTLGGRSVIVTESKSLLIWNEDTKKLKEMLTPDIKIGDCVPVTESLTKPPVILNEINLSDYLSRKEYVFHKRTIDNIAEIFVYPYNEAIIDTYIPDIYELTEENGIFIGLLLAEGYCTETTISIINNNKNIQNFVYEWFNKHNIFHSTTETENHTTSIIGYSSILSSFIKSFIGDKAENKHIPTEAYIANDCFIVGLLNGYYSGDGFISEDSVEVCSASKRLIEGISMLCSRLEIFGKVSVSHNNSYHLNIGAQWGQRFADKIHLIEENKQEKLNNITWIKSCMNFKTYENVVLDKIVEINIIGVEKHPKMYDLTIPSTLNFGLANGLQVRDTSSTGYIQRRLIKGLEDLKVEYDMTVRNNRRKIIQFSYGDDGIDSTKVESQSVPFVGMSIEDIYLHFDIAGISKDSNIEMTAVYTKGTISRLKKQREETLKKIDEYINRIIEDRDLVVKNVFRNKDDMMVKVPVSFQHLISNLHGQLGLNSHSTTDVTPFEAFEMIENTYKKLELLTFAQPTPLFKILYYFYLTPRNLLVHKRFHRKGLEMLLDSVVLRYKQAIVHPGEMVGVIAGQSIGEPTTQLTLNSVTYETEIVVRNAKHEIKKVQIGEFITDHIKKSTKIDYMEDKDTTYAELSIEEEYYEVPSSTEEGETVWTRIEAVTQHPVINEDGSDTMLKITTEGCRDVIMTRAKSALQLIDGKIVPFTCSDLRVGDYMPVSKKPLEFEEKYILCHILPATENVYGSKSIETILDYNFGYLVGAYYVEENYITNHQNEIYKNNIEYFKPIEILCKDIRIYNIFENLCVNNNISDKIIFSNKECIMGFLDAYIGGNGCIHKCSSSGRITDITVSSESLPILTNVMVMMKNMGIVANIRKINNQENIKQLYDLIVSNQQAHKLGTMLNLKIKIKQDLINTLLTQTFEYEYSSIPNKINGEIVFQDRLSMVPDLIFDKIISIEEVPNTTKYAYDLTVEGTRNFDCMNGLCQNDTFHLAGVASKSNVTRGVPRIEEILRLTDNPKKPAMTIYLKSVDEADKDRALKYANMMEYTVLKDVVKSVQICFDPLERSSFIESDRHLLDTYYAFEDMIKDCNEDVNTLEPIQKSKWIVRMELDAEALLERNITMDDVNFAIKNVKPDIQCIYSDYNEEQLIFRIRTGSNLFKKKKGDIVSLDQSDEIYLLRNFQDGLLNNIVLRGIQNIENVIPRKLQNIVVKEDGKYIKKDTWVLDTTGTNLLDVLGVDFIDNIRTNSNDIGEVFNVLGIEAARQVIFNEFSEVMEFSDVNINYHHLSLLCDRMTVTKNMVAIFRSGLHNDNIGPIAKATFEVHTEMFLNAARHADFDEMRGVSANIMCGQYGYYGTGAFNVILDMKEIVKLDASDSVIRNDNKDIDSLFSQKDDIGCAISQLKIQNNITTIHQENKGICQDQYDMGF